MVAHIGSSDNSVDKDNHILKTRISGLLGGTEWSTRSKVWRFRQNLLNLSELRFRHLS